MGVFRFGFGNIFILDSLWCYFGFISVSPLLYLVPLFRTVLVSFRFILVHQGYHSSSIHVSSRVPIQVSTPGPRQTSRKIFSQVPTVPIWMCISMIQLYGQLCGQPPGQPTFRVPIFQQCGQPVGQLLFTVSKFQLTGERAFGVSIF